MKPPPSAFDGGARKRAEELVASVADHEIVRPQPGRQRCPHFAEHLVAGRVVVGVVDRLETVDVDERENERRIRTPRAVDLVLELGQASVPPKRPGQVVDSRLRAVLAGALPIVRRRATIACSRSSVAGRPCAVASRLLALARREAALRPIALVGRTIARLRRTVAFVCRAVAPLRFAVVLFRAPQANVATSSVPSPV